MSWSSNMPPGTTAAAATRLDPIRAGDRDARTLPAFSFTDGDKLVTVDSVTVTRRDTVPIGLNDLTVSPVPPPTIDPTGLIPTIWLSSTALLLTSGSIDYQLTVAVTSQNGRTLRRDSYISVVAPLGQASVPNA